jgi:NAD(P)-dependent dehydrogenase (short-subunit alcohol dehydrogenase family)
MFYLTAPELSATRARRPATSTTHPWRRCFDVNTMGPTRVTEAFVDAGARSERKLVVTITSGINTSGGSIAYPRRTW